MSFKEWEEYRLEDVALIVDSLHQTPNYVTEGYPIVRAVDIKKGFLKLDNTFKVSEEVFKEYTRKHLPKIGDIVFSRVGSYFISSYVATQEKFCMGQNTVVMSPKINSKFLFYFLNSNDAIKQINELTSGTSQKTISIKSIKSLLIPKPCIETQEKIASILSSLDDKIELNRQMNQTLEAMAQTLFKEWFVDFNFPGADGKMVESELGMVPEGWKVGTLGQIYKTTSGGTPSRVKQEYYVGGNIPWIKSKELNNSFVTYSEEKITEEALKKSSAKLLPMYSVLIAMYGATVGEIGITSMEASCNQAICAFLPNEHYPFTFIYQFLKNNKIDIISRAVGSAQQNISQDLLKKISIILPPLGLIKDYHYIAATLFQRMENNLIQTQALIQLRDSLLPKLMKGEIEI